jgi:hypothetical protein
MIIHISFFHRLCALFGACQLGLGSSAFVINPHSRHNSWRFRIPNAGIVLNRPPHRQDSIRFRPFIPSAIGGAVMDRPVEKEGEETKPRSGDDDDYLSSPPSSSWSLSKDGEGFIPNIPSRFRPKGTITPGQQDGHSETQEKPKRKPSLLSRAPRVMQINDIHQYKTEVADVTDRIVVVRFFARKFSTHSHIQSNLSAESFCLLQKSCRVFLCRQKTGRVFLCRQKTGRVFLCRLARCAVI